MKRIAGVSLYDRRGQTEGVNERRRSGNSGRVRVKCKGDVDNAGLSTEKKLEQLDSLITEMREHYRENISSKNLGNVAVDFFNGLSVTPGEYPGSLHNKIMWNRDFTASQAGKKTRYFSESRFRR